MEGFSVKEQKLIILERGTYHILEEIGKGATSTIRLVEKMTELEDATPFTTAKTDNTY